MTRGAGLQMASETQTSTALRNDNLDVCRAMATLMVLVHHGVQMAPIRSEAVLVIANLGKHGVNLFFVLSG
jgi:peptidoglycan/LPS O-acetylase OafA/YrhL